MKYLSLALFLLTLPSFSQQHYSREDGGPACKSHPEYCLPLLTTVPSEVQRSIVEADAAIEQAQAKVGDMIRDRNKILTDLIKDKGMGNYPAYVLSYKYNTGTTFIAMQWGTGDETVGGYMHKDCTGTITYRDGFLFYIPAKDVSWCTVADLYVSPSLTLPNVVQNNPRP